MRNHRSILLLAAIFLSCYSLSLCRAQDEQLTALRKKAEAGDVDAQFNLGVLYANGQGVERNYSEALKWYRQAAEQNNAAAQNNLGAMYEDGQGVGRDYAAAFKWYRQAAEQKLAAAQVNLGLMYANGQGVKQDYAEADRWWRAAAAQNNAIAAKNLGLMYYRGDGVAKDHVEAARWYRQAAEQNNAAAQTNLGVMYYQGEGVERDFGQAFKWFRLAADQNVADAQVKLGIMYANGQGVQKDQAEAVKWYRKAAEQNEPTAQNNLGVLYANGQGVEKDYIQAYVYLNLASKTNPEAARNRDLLEQKMSPQQVAEAQQITREWKPRKALAAGESAVRQGATGLRLTGSGTGFAITEDGFIVTNEHVVKGAAQVRLLTRAGIIVAAVVKVDRANDLALLKAGGRFLPLPVTTSRAVRLGSTVATVGFPNIGLQGFAPKLAKGEIAALSGAQDDPRYFQISVPIQPGNSGGALVDERGNVVGVVSSKLAAKAALAAGGALPENVNYALRSTLLMSFLESAPELAASLQEPNLKEREFEDVVKAAEQAAVLVLAY